MSSGVILATTLLEFAHVPDIKSEVLFLLTRSIDPQIESESDCLDELDACVKSVDLISFIDSVSALDLRSYQRLELLLLRSFLKLIIGYTVEVLVQLIRLCQAAQKQQSEYIRGGSFLAKKMALYGHKKLIKLQEILTVAGDLQSLNLSELIQLSEKMIDLYGAKNPFRQSQVKNERVIVFESLLRSLLWYKDRIDLLCKNNYSSVDQFLKDQIKGKKGRILYAGILSYGLLTAVIRFFFGELSQLKSVFKAGEQSFLAVQNSLLSMQHNGVVKRSGNLDSVSHSFNWDFFLDMHNDYKNSYIPFASRLSFIFKFFDAALKKSSQFFAQSNKDLFLMGSKMAYVLQNAGLIVAYRTIFIIDMFIHLLDGIGHFGATLTFLYCAYKVEAVLKIKAFEDFAMAFELFEKELYTKFSVDLCEKNHSLYPQLLLIIEGQKIFSPEKLYMLKYDLIHITKFNSWDLVEAYLVAMKKNYDVPL